MKTGFEPGSKIHFENFVRERKFEDPYYSKRKKI